MSISGYLRAQYLRLAIPRQKRRVLLLSAALDLSSDPVLEKWPLKPMEFFDSARFYGRATTGSFGIYPE